MNYVVENQRLAGKVNRQAINEGFKYAKPGMDLYEIDHYVGTYIREQGMRPAFLGYNGFPGNICISVNDTLVHGVANDYVLQNGDLLTLDVGTSCNGCCADSATTKVIGGPSANPEGQKLVDQAYHSLWAGIHAVKEGLHLYDLAKAIEGMVQGPYIVHPMFNGHGIGKTVHEEPNIFHTTMGMSKEDFEKVFLFNKQKYLRAGQVICIEPVITTKSIETILDNDKWTIRTKHGQLSAHEERMVLVEEHRAVVLS